VTIKNVTNSVGHKKKESLLKDRILHLLRDILKSICYCT